MTDVATRRESPAAPAYGGEAPWAETADAVACLLGVDPAAGLAGADALERLRRHGENVAAATTPRAWWRVLLDQFKGALVALLAAAAALSAGFGEWAEAGAILAVLALNAAIGFATQLKAVRSVEALRRLGAPTARVRRDGRLLVVPAATLVPGDVLIVEAGDLVGADARLVKASRLEADESSLTGESVPVAKAVAAIRRAAEVHERAPMLHMGTAVTRGAGEAVVVATGAASELGRVGRLVGTAAPPGTPLEARLAGLAHRLLWLTLVVAVTVTLTGIGSGKGWLVLVQTAIALAVATVPEGLPVIATLTLAGGVRRMARRNALVNRLAAVETLGATSVIITDKTGTLTENRLTVAQMWLPSGVVTLGEGGPHDPSAARVRAVPPPPATQPAGATETELDAELRHALTLAALCVTAELPAGAEAGAGVGDPLELALLAAARDAGVERASVLARHPELAQESFDADTRLMATVHRGAVAEGTGSHVWVAVKGAPGEVVSRAVEVVAAGGGRREPLTAAARELWLERNRELAARGWRVLALAERRAAAPPPSPYEELALVGLVALADPPRAGVKEAVARCRAAGIRVLMATGDQAVTAARVAEEVGLDGGAGVLDGRAVATLLEGGAAGRRELAAAGVLARLSPEQKLRLVELHQERGDVVAMTGDGVNDAPALRRADIGVAMGLRGTEVAREAADMVLLDDAFPTIVAAVEEGRAIFESIRAFVVYLLSCNLSEVLVIGVAGLAGYPLPLLPLQILFLNLVTDVLPALALGAGRGDGRGGARSMTRPPRPADEPLLAGRHWRSVVGYGSLLTTVTLGAFVAAFRLPGATTATAVTVAFLVLALGQVWHVFNMREPGAAASGSRPARDGWLWSAALTCSAVLGLAVALPGPRELLGVELLGAGGWALVAVGGLLPLLLGRLCKALGLGRVA